MSKAMKRVKWLRPTIVKNTVTWPERCQATITTPQSVAWNKAHGRGTDCNIRAKIDYRGVKLCPRHAAIRALEELAGPSPVEQINATR